MSIEALERAAMAPIRFFRLLSKPPKSKNREDRMFSYSSSLSSAKPLRSSTRTLALPVPPPQPGADSFRSVHLVPGGRFLLTCSLHFLHIWDLDAADAGETRSKTVYIGLIKDCVGLSSHPEACGYDFELQECYRTEKEDTIRFVSVMTPHTSIDERGKLVKDKKANPKSIIHLFDATFSNTGSADGSSAGSAAVAIRVLCRLAYNVDNSPRVHYVTDTLVVIVAKKRVMLWNWVVNSVAEWETFDDVNALHLTSTHIVVLGDSSQVSLFRLSRLEFTPSGGAANGPAKNAIPKSRYLKSKPTGGLPDLIDPSAEYSINADSGLSNAIVCPRAWFTDSSWGSDGGQVATRPYWDALGNRKTLRWTLERVLRTDYGATSRLPPFLPAVHGTVLAPDMYGLGIESNYRAETNAALPLVPCIDDKHAVLAVKVGNGIRYAAYVVGELNENDARADELAADDSDGGMFSDEDMSSDDEDDYGMYGYGGARKKNQPARAPKRPRTVYGALTPGAEEDDYGLGKKKKQKKGAKAEPVAAEDMGDFSLCAASGRLCYVQSRSGSIIVMDYLT